MRVYDSIECKNCGNIVPKGKHCIYCGEDVSKNIQKEFLEVVCPNCESITPKGDFCLYCGEDISKEKLYVRAGDCISRNYFEFKAKIDDFNIFFNIFFNVKEFSYYEFTIYFKNGTEQKVKNIIFQDFKDLDIVNIIKIQISIAFPSYTFIEADFMSRNLFIKYNCEEILYLLNLK